MAWDYYNYQSVNVFPRQPAIKRLFDAYYQSGIAHGGSYDIAEKLPELLLQSGMQIDQLVPINRAARPDSATWRWVSLFHQSYVPKLIEAGLLSEEEAEEFRRAWKQAENDAASFFFTPPMLGIIASKPG